MSLLAPTLLCAFSLQDGASAWEERARAFAFQGDDDRELLARIEALGAQDTERRRREVGRLEERRRRLLLTVRHPLDEGPGLQGLAVSADGRWLVTTTNTAVVWDVETGRRASTLAHPEAIDRLALDAAGDLVATVSNRELRVWTRAGRLLLGPESLDGRWVYSLVLSPSGHRLAIGREDGDGENVVELWALGESPRKLAELSHPTDPWNLSFSPDGRHLVEAHGGVRVWNALDGALVAEPVGWFEPEEDDEQEYPPECNAAAFHPTEDRIAIAMSNGVLRTWDLERGAFDDFRGAVSGYVELAAFDPQRRRWVCADRSAAYACDAATGRPAGLPLLPDDLDDWGREKYSTNPVALSPDGTRFAIAGLGDSARVWDTVTGERLEPVVWHGAVVERLAFTGDARLVTGSADGVVRVWATEPLDPSPRRGDDHSCAVYVAPGDEHALVVRETGHVLVAEFDGRTARLEHDESRVYDLSVSRDGSAVAATTGDRRARVWSLPDGEPLGAPLLQDEFIMDLALDPRGRRLAVGTYWMLRSWDLQRGVPAEAAAAYVEEVAFAPDGRLMGVEDGGYVFEAGPGSTRFLPTDDDAHHALALDGSGRVRFEGDEVAFVDSEETAHRVDDLAPSAERWEAGAGRVFAIEKSSVTLIDPWSREVVATIDHRRSLENVGLAGERLATWGGGTVKIWDTRGGGLLAEVPFESEVTFALPVPGADRFVVATTGETVEVVETRTGETVGSPLELARESQRVAFDGTERALVVAANGDVLAIDLSTGRADLIQDLGLTQVLHVALSPDGSRLVVVLAPDEVELWDLSTRERVGVWRFDGRIDGGHPFLGPPELSVGFDPTGNRLLIAPTCWVPSGGGRSPAPNVQRVVDTRTGDTICELDMPRDAWIGPAAFDSTGTRVAMALHPWTTEVWDTGTGERVHAFEFDAMRGAVAFVPGTEVLVTVGERGRFASWDVGTGAAIVPPSVLRERYNWGELSPDARSLYSVDEDGVAHLIDLVSGETLVRQAGLPTSIVFGPRADEVLLFGAHSVHLVRIEAGAFVPIASRPVHWTSDSWSLFGTRSGCVLRDDGTAVLGAASTESGARLVRYDFRNPLAEPVAGSPEELRDTWSRRLGLEVTGDGAIRARQ